MVKPNNETVNKEVISDDLKELVIARLDATIPPDKKISIGSESEEFSKGDLIEHVMRGDEIGKKVIDIELTFLRAMQGGELLRDVLSSNE